MRTFPAPGALALLVSILPAQTYATGWQDFAFTNATSQGSPTIPCRVHYPALTQGQGAAVLPRPGGWPVVVFLHGAGSMGSDYSTVSGPLARSGYVAVMVDDARYDMVLLAQDATALHAILQQENLTSASPLFGALDMTHAAVQGYSMGGGSTLRVLASNPGYLAGFCHAPAFYATATANVVVPLGIVHGSGDTVVPLASSQTYFRDATSFTGTKTLYVFNNDGDHNNIVTTYLSRPQDLAVCARVQKVFLGFFATYLRGEAPGLEEVVGTSAASEPRLATILHSVQAPQLWIESTGRLGDALRITQNGEPGTGFTLVATGRATQQTPFGIFELDPATTTVLWTPTFGSRRVSVVDVAIPLLPGLVGKVFSFQGTALTVGPTGRLTSTTDLPIVP